METRRGNLFSLRKKKEIETRMEKEGEDERLKGFRLRPYGVEKG